MGFILCFPNYSSFSDLDFLNQDLNFSNQTRWIFDFLNKNNTVKFQEKRRKSTRIEIKKISRRSKKRGDAPVDDEVIRVEALLDEAVRRRLQDKPEGTQPTEVHEDAFRDVFGPEHSGRVRCLGAGTLPSQVFPELCKRTIYTPSYHSNSNMTAEFKEMQEKIKEMEAREVQR
ncbi:uncharacterized protein LOC122010694 [Zingiber officinale]|uniref:uncharacterized protein LOC122010694 n=1 Tax=Zingiber officinale TaxID=94328 RepID=UPI001C4C1110|nr:uncharacterized protein LOC122010694 [Zingiber officinale]